MVHFDTAAEKLTPEQVTAVTCLLAHPTIEAAAKAAQVSRTQLYRWMEDANFQAALKAAEAELLEQVVRRLTATATEAIEVLRAIMNNKRTAAGVRVRAAIGILDQTTKLKQINDLNERIAALEAR